MEHLFREEEVGRSVWGILRYTGDGLASHQLVKDVCAELKELHRGQAQEFIAGLVGLLLRNGVAGVEKGSQGHVMFAEDSLVELSARVVAAAFASCVHVCAAARAADRGGRRWAAGAPGAAREAVDAHGAVGAARVGGRGEVSSIVAIGAVVGRGIL